MSIVKIGTRGSKLALWQAEFIADKLKKNGLEPEIQIIETRGDKILDVSISKIGSKGVFTEELENLLRKGTIDIAVHSAKDLASNLPDDLNIIAFTEREKVNDVLISHNRDISLNNEKIVIGTSSTRRIATLKYYYKKITTREVRGNLQTRIRKMEEGNCDALILAYAGVKRMGYDNLIVEELPLDKFTPSVGQGSLAIEATTTLDYLLAQKIKNALNHKPTEILLRAERAFLKELEGGCSIPAFALASYLDKLTFKLTAGLFTLDGSKIIREEKIYEIENAREAGTELACKVLENGGQEILKEIRKILKKA